MHMNTLDRFVIWDNDIEIYPDTIQQRTNSGKFARFQYNRRGYRRNNSKKTLKDLGTSGTLQTLASEIAIELESDPTNVNSVG